MQIEFMGKMPSVNDAALRLNKAIIHAAWAAGNAASL
jgi:hypothetical protein